MGKKRQPIKVIKRSEMAANYTMSEAIESMSVAFAKLASGECYVPSRSVVSSRDESLTILFKPAFIDTGDKSSIKLLTQRNSGPVPGIPTIMGFVLLIDNTTGEILSLMDGEFITALRTGAASGLATKYFSREDSKRVAVFGCGKQGRTQLEAVDAVRSLERVWIFDKSREQAESFVKDMEDIIEAPITIADDPAVLREADIICTATNSTEPLFFKEHIKPGTHINAIGSFKPTMRELDPEIILSSRIYFDDKESCVNESGDFVHMAEKYVRVKDNIVGEIGEYGLHKIPGRSSVDEVTLFKSVGTAIQDFVVADRIYEKAVTGNFGYDIRLYE